MGVRASIIVCDDILISLQGKVTIVGMYTSDLTIFSESVVASQVAFLTMIEADLEDLPDSMHVEITFPGEKPQVIAVQSPGTIQVGPNRSKIVIKVPAQAIQITLRPGKIEAKVVYPGGETVVAAPWIVQLPAPTDTTKQ